MLSRYSHLKYSREPLLSDKILLSHTLIHVTSFQCAKYMEEDRPLQVLHSAAGWYIGAACERRGPLSRDSEEYYPSERDAQLALVNQSWTQRMDP